MRRLLQLLLLSILGGIADCHAAMLEGQVSAVLSGDRITVRTANGAYREVKLAGIRIPTHDKTSAIIAHRHLRMLLAGHFVSVEYTTLSASGVILGSVFHGGSDIALRMLDDGLAVARFHPGLNPSMANRYSQAEAAARSRGLGFWQKLR
jgi:endonuclease YncB( thermonuclease family)